MIKKTVAQSHRIDGVPATPRLYRSASDQLNRSALWGHVRYGADLSDADRDMTLANLSNRLVQHGLTLSGSMNVFIVMSSLGELEPSDKQVLVDVLSEQALVSSFEIGEPVPLVGLATGVVPVGLKPLEHLTQEDALVFNALVLRLCEIALSSTPGRPSAHHAAFMHLMYP